MGVVVSVPVLLILLLLDFQWNFVCAFYEAFSRQVNNCHSTILWNLNTAHTTTILWPLYRSTCISWHLHLQLEDSVGEKFYCPHTLADGNRHVQISEKMLDFSAALSTLSLYLLSPYSFVSEFENNGVHCGRLSLMQLCYCIPSNRFTDNLLWYLLVEEGRKWLFKTLYSPKLRQVSCILLGQ